MTIIDRLRAWAVELPDQPCITCLDDDGRGTTRSYGEIATAVAARTGALIDAGVGERVGLVASNDLDTVITMLAVLAAGRCCVLLNPSDPPTRTADLLAGADAGHAFRSACADRVDLRSTRELIDRQANPTMPIGPAFIVPTSGSTAASKLVSQSHRAVLSNAEGVRLVHQLEPGDTVLGGLPICHVNGLHFTVMGIIRAGAHVVIPSKISPFTYLDLISRWNARMASVVPAVLDSVIACRPRWRPPASFQYFVTAAAPLQSRTAAAVLMQWNCRIVQAYGLTETTNFSTTMPRNISTALYHQLMIDTELPPVGAAFPGQQVEILDEQGHMLPDGAIGEICMRGDAIMDCYFGNTAATRSALVDGWFHSGDLGCWRRVGDHRLFYVTGRLKNIAKVRGESVSLEEIERRAVEVPGITDAGATAHPDPLEGEVVTLYVVGAAAALSRLNEHLAACLAPLHRPRHINHLDVLPRTPTGKLRRRELAHKGGH